MSCEVALLYWCTALLKNGPEWTRDGTALYYAFSLDQLLPLGRWLYPYPALVTSALQRALLAQRPAPGLVVHSDRGGQYAGNAYKAPLRGAQAQLSHSRRGECYDNAQAESRWSRLKTEELEAHDWPVFADVADAQASVADYFEYYNHKRRHSSIGYLKLYLFHQQQLVNIT